MNRSFIALAALACGCTDHRPPLTAGGISSLQLTLKSPDPAKLGQPNAPVTAPTTATFDITALDDNDQLFPGEIDVQVYLSFGGVKIGANPGCFGGGSLDPLATVHLSAGKVQNYQVALPPAYGATTIWLDEPFFHATGASPTMYLRNPYVSEVQTPPDLSATNATYCTPFNNKFIIVDQASQGGRLVVSSVFGDAFTVTDTGPGDYLHFNSIYLYAFGKPPSYIVPGKILTRFSGNIAKFVGFTEVNFPLFYLDVNQPENPSLLPPPVVVTNDDTANLPKLLSLDAGVVTLTDVECDPQAPGAIDQWRKYNQFVVGAACDSFNDFAVELPEKVLGSFDPLQTVGRTITFTGMLQNSSGQNPVPGPAGTTISCSTKSPCKTGNCVEGECRKNPFNFWTIKPRTPDDVIVH
jgi:hypothetical protein